MQRYSHLCLPALLTVVSALACCPQAQAITLFGDTFDRPDNRDIDAVTTGITNNTGTVFGASAVYSTPWVDPANQTTGPDTNAANGGGQQIVSNEYQKNAAGTANLFVNSNFTNASILSAGGFSVSLDIKEIATQNDVGRGAAIAIGMTQAKALAGHDANDGNPAPIAKYTNAFQNTAFTTGAVEADFYLGLRGDGTMAWGSGGTSGAAAPTTISVAPGTASNGTISANFGVTNFNAGSLVNYEVFFNGVSKGTGSFTWSTANSNYIGVDSRDGTRVRMDNFTISTIVPPPKPTLLVNRDTGNITIQNLTNTGLSIAAYSIIIAQGGFNQANWNKIQTQGIDTNDTWYTFTDPSSTTDLAEGTLGEYTIPATTGTINLGNAWRRSPFEDLAFELRDASGNDVPVLVNYTGNSGNAFRLGDFSLTGGLDAADWVVLRNHLTSNVSALSQIDRYFVGDLNNDGLVNQTDFRQFKALYTAGNGAGSFEAMLASIPEPSSVVILLIAAALLLTWRWPARQRAVVRISALTVAICGLTAGNIRAADLFVDTFNRPDNTDIDAVTTGITNNTGEVFGTSAVYSQPWIDPNSAAPIFGPPDTNAANGGGQQILNNEYQLKYGMGTSNSFVNHNFTNASILSAHGFRVSLDVTGYNQATNGQGAAIGVGMSLSEAQNGKDAFGGSPELVAPGFKYTNAFQSGTTNVATTANVLSDFYVALRGDSTLAWGVGTGNSGGTGAPAPSFTTVAVKTGTISAEFVANDFSAGSSVAYQVFYNGVSQGFGAFRWSGTNENYIGLDSRDDTATRVDNYKIETVTGLTPQVLRLQVNTSSGAVSVVGGGSSNSLDYYEINSAGGGLVASNFNGIRGDGGLPAGNGSGNGWELGGSNSSTSLTEAYLTGQSTIAAAAAGLPIGSIYNTGANSQDLQFTYYTNDSVQHIGMVEYVTSVLPDFNGNGFVDAADYVVWRKNNGRVGGATLSQGDANGDGNVNSTDYNLWRASFGLAAGSGVGSLASGTVPEPSTGLLLVAAVGLYSAFVRHQIHGRCAN
jgi:dockerin type I repeat protein